MGRKCNVADCPSDANRPEDVGVTFHKLPMHPDLRPKWMDLCRIPDDKKLVKILYVCSRHFLRADFCNFKGKKYMLRQGVLPSVFPWDKSKLKAIKAEAVAKKDDSANVMRNESESTEIKQEPLELVTDINLEPGCESDVKMPQALSFTINSKIEALDFNNDWFLATIVEVDYEENEVLIHFDDVPTKSDEWISMNSSRLRAPQITQKDIEKPIEGKNMVEQYTVGERCLAAWSDNRKFPATVTKVVENDTYEVLFDDGYVKTLKAHRMSKQVEGKALQASPLFEPIKSSKQDRREKKRKLNVADLFKKRAKTDSGEEKSPKRVPAPPRLDIVEPILPEVESEMDIENWRPRWIKGKPVGTDATLDTADGPKHSTIVPDPRLPEGWKKHLLRRNQGTYAGKWDTIIVSPDNKRFRSRTDIRTYLEQNPIEGVNENMFCFSLVGNSRKRRSNVTPRKSSTTAKKPVEETKVPAVPAPQEQTEVPMQEEVTVKEEENPNSLKIIFQDDSYKCPIEGCGKNFRRENLAQMHVKHYHPEYTKFLDSTPNVADLAYARTVGDSLDRSPGPTKAPSVKPAAKTSTPKISKSCNSPVPEMPEQKPAAKANSPSISQSQNKDAEIIKLLNSKTFVKSDSEAIQPLPSGLPSSAYPEINLKGLLGKNDVIPKRDENLLKTLCMSRPHVGIKTLLPVVRLTTDSNQGSSTTTNEYGKRKRPFSDNVEIIKGKENTNLPPTSKSQSLQQKPIQTESQQTTTTLDNNLPSPLPHPSDPDTFPPTLDSTPSQPPPPNNIIIEGGEIIKIVRMKQEEIINCTCGYTEEDGLMIQCELCLCWQHAYCNNIERESQVPEKYVCWICQNPQRERLSRKYWHDQEWLKQGVLPTGSYHYRDEEALKERFEKLKKCHDLSGGFLELQDYVHSLGVKLKIAGAKNHPKLYLWSNPWEKKQLPEKAKEENEDVKPKMESKDHEYMKDGLDVDKNENESMLMMILKAGKEAMPKMEDLNNLMDNSSPIIPRPEAAIDSTDCRLNLLEHILHEESLVEQRLDDFEKQLDALEEGLDIEKEEHYPKTRATVQMLMKDLDKLKEFSLSTTI